MADAGPLLSVVITGYTKSRLPDVFDLLESLKAQTYPHIEIVFVGEREPELCERVREYAHQQGMANVLVLFNDGEPGVSVARNMAIPKANGELIAFLDDDVVAFPDWAEAMIGAFAESDAIGVTGAALPLWDDPGMAWFPQELDWLLSCTGWSGWDQVREVRSAWGMNMAFRREGFEVAGGFLSTLGYHTPMAEDLEFSLRVKARTGKRIIFSPHVRVWHRVRDYRLSWRFVAARAHHIGVSRRLLKKLYPQSPELFAPEKQLLTRVVGLLLNTPRQFLRSPRTAWRRLFLISLTSCAAAWGYFRPGTSLEVLKEGWGAEGG